MNCPVCSISLVIAERQGVEIDYCPKCRGIWLDRGELDKIIEKSNNYNSTPTNNAESFAKADYSSEKQYDRDKYPKDDYYKGRKKKSFLDDLFDF